MENAKRTLELKMYDTSANRSYYAIFHVARAVLALDRLDFKKHSGSLRIESDYEDFYVIAKADVENQVEEADIFY